MKELVLQISRSAGMPSDLNRWVKKSKFLKSVEKIPGDASARKYYRVSTTEGSTFVVMKMESFSSQGEDLPFLAVQKYLQQVGVNVPKVFDFEAKQGYILLEDLGDMTLLRKLQSVGDTDVERHLYERAIDGLVHLQSHATPKKGQKLLPKLDAFKLRFDYTKLMWEMDFTIEHFYEKHLKRTIKDKDRKIMKQGLGAICQKLADEPTVFTHRDFHSRNIMVTEDERLVMIDFQDARLGPAQYDLVSLLKDSYYQLEEAQIQHLQQYYLAKWEAVTSQRLRASSFAKTFDWMAVQRNFKAIGSFASFLNRRGDATYLKYIGNTFENIRRVLLKYPEYSALREVLFHYYYF